ncbi:EAL domain-containing protein [Neptunomonas marina]|uniref:EAL domain-containing protein n=1 Tax=Neptunomonas marina TaxID=1815562 RepID=A0A437QAU3_9GAMM|nr:EAL domain-containing protein [Neptunomonas marina]
MSNREGVRLTNQPLPRPSGLRELGRLKEYVVPAIFSLTMTFIIGAAFLFDQIKESKAERLHSLQSRAEVTAQWIDQNFSEINQQLIGLERFAGRCDDEVLFQMRSTLFSLSQVVELGFVNPTGELDCTSWEQLDQPLKVSKAPQQYGLRFLGPLVVEFMRQPAFVLARTIRDKGEINALLRVSWLREQIRNRTSNLGFIALIDSDTGVPIVLNGDYTLPLNSKEKLFPVDGIQTFEGIFDNGREQVIHFAPLLTLPHLSVVVSDESNVLYTNLVTVQPMWFLAGSGVFLFFLALSILLQRYILNPAHQLKHAIQQREFFNLYQPLRCSETGQLVGVEVLVRWLHPSEGLKSPVTFIPEAESTGLVKQMTALQLEQCAEELAPVLAELPELWVHVNISAQHLIDRRSIERFIAYKQKIPGLVLEITEGHMLALSSDLIRQSLQQLKAAGVRIAIDDFGTGYCGLSYLRELPVDILKADKSFIAAMGTDAVNADVLKTILTLARQLNLTTVAEGVETAEQDQQLRTMGVDLQQGWHHGYPMTAEALLNTHLRADTSSG